MEAMSAATADKPYLEFVSEDVVVMHTSASNGEDLAVTAENLKKRAENGRFFLIVDFTGATTGIDSNTRERGANLVKAEWMRGCVYINASMPIRAALKVINLAMFLAGKADFPSEYVKSFDEAYAAIDRMRAAAA